MNKFVCIPPSSRIALSVAMETMHSFKVQLTSSLRTIFCISVVQINDLKKSCGCIKLAPGVLRLWAVLEEKNVCRTFARTNIRPDKAKFFNPST